MGLSAMRRAGAGAYQTYKIVLPSFRFLADMYIRASTRAITARRSTEEIVM